MSIYVGDKEIKNLYIGESTSVSDMQGPCPDGFHVPLSSELEGIGGLKEIMSGLGLTTGDSWRINLHLPFAGKRRSSNSSISGQGSRGYYWSSSPYDGNQYNSRNLLMEPSGVYQNSSYERANGFSIRCFKNSYVSPDSTWTVVQGTLGSAGIFWNQSEGLISITDGSTGYTIMDKNLGATTVYNDGDTLSEANCGKYYQRGNNYGFAWTGSVTTSSTTINASNYGPGNYYESSTFIVNSSYEGYWDSSLNTNLRGGVSQGTSTEALTAKEIYLGDVKVWPIINFATQGPAPSEFHVPLQSEWSGLKTIMDGLGLTAGNNWRVNLHMPFAGNRYYFTTNLNNQGSYGSYWSSSSYGSSSPDFARSLFLSSSYISADNSGARAYGFSVRCFKDSFEAPLSSWTVINGTLGGAGIFWNQTDGLISITSDGTTGYTIQDKNLGATTVYNNGDTLTQANMGNMYQWGNNYGFPSTGSVSKTSSTQVNASTYGPGNYYSSDTFIARSSEPYDWSSVQNDNLRGGVDGNVPV